MATQIQYRRGTNAQNVAFTGALGEITVDTTNGTLRVHDGITAGGSNIATVSYVTSQISALSSNSITDGTSNVKVYANGNVATTVAGSANVLLVTSSGVLVTGLISATGNITGNYLFGNGSQLTGIDATSIQSGTSNVRVVSSGGNVAAGVGGTANVVVIATTGQFITGVNSVSGNVTGGNIITAGFVTATGNVSGGNLVITGNIIDTGALGINTTANANITLNAGSGFIIASSGILNGQANGVGNIGNSTGYFNTIFAKATSAQYADLAEMYVSDADHGPGTVVVFGGNYEVEISTTSHANHVAGVVSTNPSYIMNAGQTGQHVVAVALQGRVPTKVIGPVSKGDRMVTSLLPGVAQALDPGKYEPGCIIGKALSAHQPTFDNQGNEIPGTIEVVVGRV